MSLFLHVFCLCVRLNACVSANKALPSRPLQFAMEISISFGHSFLCCICSYRSTSSCSRNVHPFQRRSCAIAQYPISRSERRVTIPPIPMRVLLEKSIGGRGRREIHSFDVAHFVAAWCGLHLLQNYRISPAE